MDSLLDEFHARNYGSKSVQVFRNGEMTSEGVPLPSFNSTTAHSKYALKNREEAWAEGFASLRWTPEDN